MRNLFSSKYVFQSTNIFIFGVSRKMVYLCDRYFPICNDMLCYILSKVLDRIYSYLCKLLYLKQRQILQFLFLSASLTKTRHPYLIFNPTQQCIIYIVVTLFCHSALFTPQLHHNILFDVNDRLKVDL